MLFFGHTAHLVGPLIPNREAGEHLPPTLEVRSLNHRPARSLSVYL